jgi:hypothetical protein
MKEIKEIIENGNEIKAIHFQQEQTFGYKSRLIKNANADATIAIAYDFNTDAERLTKTSVLSQNKKYIPLKIPKKIIVDSDPPSTMTGTYELDKSLIDSKMPDFDYYTNIYNYRKGNLMMIYINFREKKRFIIEIDEEIKIIKIKIHSKYFRINFKAI